MVILARASMGIERDSSALPEEEPVLCVTDPSTLPGGRSTVRVLTTPDEVAAAVERAQAFERRTAAHLAARASRHAAALARSSQTHPLGT
jgi:hypothetical protein